jgi:hypothetical protein
LRVKTDPGFLDRPCARIGQAAGATVGDSAVMLTKTQSVHGLRRGRGRGKLPVVLIAVWLGGAWGAPVASPPLYRWTDENGITVYSERPPPGAEATRLIPDPGPSPEESERAQQRIRSLVEQDYDRREESKHEAQASGEQAEREARRRANCEAARRNLATLEDPRTGRVRTAEGALEALSDEVRARYLEEAREVIRENCD